MKAEFTTVSQYLAAQPAPVRRVLQTVRATIRKALPRATEGISYKMPVVQLDGAMVLYYAGYAKFFSIYPATPHVLDALGDEVADFVHNKATLRFSLDAPVPTRLITRIAKLRAAEVAASRAPRGRTGTSRSGRPRTTSARTRARRT